LPAGRGARGVGFSRAIALAIPVGLALTFPARAAYSPSAEGTGLAVAADHAEATRAALEALHAGGNAVDGAISAALTLGVVGPNASGLGGGGFALIYVAKERRAYAIDFRETAPAEVSTDGIVSRAANEEPTRRGVAIGVPGEPAGLEWLSKRFARRSLAADAASAAALARDGFSVTRNVLRSVDWAHDEIATSPVLSSEFLIAGGATIPFGRIVRRPELAQTITRFGAEGARPFYQGDIAAEIVKAAASVGGTLSAADLAGYQPKERDPLARNIDGRTVVTFPAPSAGGLMLLEILTMFGATRNSALAPMGFESSAYLHTVAEGIRGALGDRARIAGDPDVDPEVTAAYERALDPQQLAARRSRIDLTHTHPAPEFRLREQGTSHVVVADREGNVISLTTTVNEAFGARVLAGGTGILLNDELDDFSTPSDVKAFGVIGLGPNRPRPHARPVSSMTPTIVIEDGVPILAVGGSGGGRIATGVTQATLARLVFGLDPGACVSAPRLHIDGPTPELLLPADVPEDVRQGLRARGETVRDERYPFAAVQMIAWERAPLGGARVLSAADPRKEGFAIAE
ncbi:MAG: gamma-glutamyltransferase family protein, partial [Polyangiaceae bacterium]